jgi:hypothetical protein
MAKYVTKKRVILVAVAALAIGLGTSAFAYFSSTGAGTGTASVGTSSALQLTSDPVGPLYPGGADVPVDVTIHNPGSGSEYVGHVSGSFVTSGGGCQGTWFQADGFDADTNLAAGASTTVQTNVRMLDSNSNQDACKNASMTINWSSN